jgi:hypothetical protein
VDSHHVASDPASVNRADMRRTGARPQVKWVSPTRISMYGRGGSWVCVRFAGTPTSPLLGALGWAVRPNEVLPWPIESPRTISGKPTHLTLRRMVGLYARLRGKPLITCTAAFFELDKTVLAKSGTLTFSKSFYQGGQPRTEVLSLRRWSATPTATPLPGGLIVGQNMFRPSVREAASWPGTPVTDGPGSRVTGGPSVPRS